MRELSEFFHDMDEVACKIVEELIESRKQKNFLKQSLKRLIKKGYLEKRDNKFIKTKLGRRFFIKHTIEKETKEINSQNRWYVLSFDIPVKDNSKRDALRWILKKFGFFQLQRSVWVGPNKLAQDIWEFIVESRIEKYCFPMIVEIIEGEGRLLEKIKRAKA